MSVFTTVLPETLQPWLKRYPLGELVSLQGIAAGVTNTNYFVTTTTGKYVLTLFEALTAQALPYYVHLMIHLAQHGVAVAKPVARGDGQYIDLLANKPTVLMTCLPGEINETPDTHACFTVGNMLARMHQYGQTFRQYMKNPRGRQWREATANQIYHLLPLDEATLLHHEISTLQQLDQYALPQGVIHADLFRDNVLMDGEEIGGLIDFYYACNDALLFDVAVTLNDWCLTDNNKQIDDSKAQAFLQGYQKQRPFMSVEISVWPLMLRAAAVRFWLSRLYDFYCPLKGEMTYLKDPTHFKNILLSHLTRQDYWLVESLTK
jgi:homoserine kinase type II